MTASALASPALSESSLTSPGSNTQHKAQTSKDQIDQSHNTSSQSAYTMESNNASAPSPAASTSSLSSSPSLSHSSPEQTHIHHPVHPLFTPTSAAAQQQHHHLQILGNHPASPAGATFLDMPEDPFMPTRANLLFSDCEYKQEYHEPVYESEQFMSYPTTAPSAEDCQPSSEYVFASQQQQRVKNEFSHDQFANLGGVNASVGPSYMMSAMARSFSDSQLSDISSFDSSAPFSSGQAGLNQATCQSPMSYGNQSQVVYNDDYYASAHQHNLYSQQHSQHYHQHHQHHQHSYSTSSLSSLSEDSPLSSRSSFSSNSSLSLSSSASSIASSTYPLSRTLSEPSIPFFQSNVGSAVIPASGTLPDGTPIIKPTPKRSRGRRVSCNPDSSGGKVFTCRFEDCGKVFKRSEHLKRHVRSIHTMEKPFECPIQNCPKRFSRSDNLNQHIRIHRHNGRGDKNSKAFTAFTPFLQNYSNELLSMS
ncbi:hypothetical protein BGZ67_009777 [Mortierella alpina]|nr:hypothetical protein BGZ67_009777 [Mortierella alpina]